MTCGRGPVSEINRDRRIKIVTLLLDHFDRQALLLDGRLLLWSSLSPSCGQFLFLNHTNIRETHQKLVLSGIEKAQRTPRDENQNRLTFLSTVTDRKIEQAI